MKMRFSLIAAAGLFLTACQTAPEAPAPEPVVEAPPPVEVPAPPSADTPRVNEWGGEVPENKPAVEVEEDDLGDLS